MERDDQTSWLDDSFDDKKTQEEIDRLKGSNRLGCALLIVVAIVVLVITFSFIGILGTLSVR